MPIPTELRMWLKEQMRAIENKTLDEDLAFEILTMLEEWKHTGHAKEVCEIINELKAEKNICNCGQICVDAEDRLCHDCYHQSVGDEECYCNKR